MTPPLCGNVHRAGLTGRPHARAPPGLRCSRRRFPLRAAPRMPLPSDWGSARRRDRCRRRGSSAPVSSDAIVPSTWPDDGEWGEPGCWAELPRGVRFEARELDRGHFRFTVSSRLLAVPASVAQQADRDCSSARLSGNLAAPECDAAEIAQQQVAGRDCGIRPVAGSRPNDESGLLLIVRSRRLARLDRDQCSHAIARAP